MELRSSASSLTSSAYHPQLSWGAALRTQRSIPAADRGRRRRQCSSSERSTEELRGADAESFVSLEPVPVDQWPTGAGVRPGFWVRKSSANRSTVTPAFRIRLGPFLLAAICGRGEVGTSRGQYAEGRLDPYDIFRRVVDQEVDVPGGAPAAVGDHGEAANQDIASTVRTLCRPRIGKNRRWPAG